MPTFDYGSAHQIVPQVLQASWDEASIRSTAAVAKADEITTAIGTLNTVLDYTAPDLSDLTQELTDLTLTAPAALSPPNALTTNFTGYSGSVSSSAATATTIVEPTIDIPLSQSADDLLDKFDVKYGELIDVLAAKFVAFRAAYFPDEQNAYLAAEDWLQAAIANPDAGLPATVVQQIWGDDHARITADKQRAQDAVISQFAARRFPLPPDVAAAMTMQLEQKAQDEMAESSRKVAILSTELQKFNVEKLLGLRQSAMGSTIEYVKALASGPDIASRVIGIGYDAESKFISSVSQFYNARIQAAESYNKVAQANSSLALEASKTTEQLTLDGSKHVGSLTLEAQKTNNTLSFDASKHNQSIVVQTTQANTRTMSDFALAQDRKVFDIESKQREIEYDILLKDKGFELQQMELKVKNMQQELSAIAAMATALYNNLHVSAGISGGGSTSVSYQYQGEVSAAVAAIGSTG
jgi:hypothetical protein